MTAVGRSAAVVGGGLGGLSAALHLRLAGYDVDLFERLPACGGRAGSIDTDGYHFDTGPTLVNYPWVFEELFAAAGRRLADYVDLYRLEPTVRFVWPDGEDLTLSSDLPALQAELARHEAGRTSGTMAFLADAEAKFSLAMRSIVTRNADSVWSWFAGLGARGFARTAVWRSMRSELSQFFRSPRVLDALGSYAMYLGGDPRRLPGIFTILPYGELAYGLWAPRGGISALVRAIVRLAGEVGVRIHTGAEVRQILHGDAAVSGLEFADGSRGGWSTVVCNVDVPLARRTLLRTARPVRPPEMTPGVVTCYLGLRAPVVGLPHHTIFMPADTRHALNAVMAGGSVPEDLAFYACSATVSDPSLAPPGAATLFLLAPVPLAADGAAPDDEGSVERVRGLVLRRLAAHGYGVPEAAIVTETRWGPAAWRDRLGLYRGSAFGAAHILRQLGPWRSPNRDPGVKGLYYVGASTTPGTGMPMVILSGRMTAERVLADAH